MSQSGRAMQRKAICFASGAWYSRSLSPGGEGEISPFPRSLRFRGSWEQPRAESLGREEADRGSLQRRRVVAGRVEVTLSHRVEAMAIRNFFLGTQKQLCASGTPNVFDTKVTELFKKQD